jgi:hypothetical protein
MYGFLRRFPEAFPKWKVEEGGEVLVAAVQSMGEILKSQWDTFPESRKWLEVIGKIVGWDEPETTI